VTALDLVRSQSGWTWERAATELDEFVQGTAALLVPAPPPLELPEDEEDSEDDDWSGEDPGQDERIEP
jgi:hypothetical protein